MIGFSADISPLRL